MLIALKEAIDRDTWLKFADTATANGHSVGDALRTLIQIYIEDASFSPQPKP